MECAEDTSPTHSIRQSREQQERKDALFGNSIFVNSLLRPFQRSPKTICLLFAIFLALRRTGPQANCNKARGRVEAGAGAASTQIHLSSSELRAATRLKAHRFLPKFAKPFRLSYAPRLLSAHFARLSRLSAGGSSRNAMRDPTGRPDRLRRLSARKTDEYLTSVACE